MEAGGEETKRLNRWAGVLCVLTSVTLLLWGAGLIAMALVPLGLPKHVPSTVGAYFGYASIISLISLMISVGLLVEGYRIRRLRILAWVGLVVNSAMLLPFLGMLLSFPG